MGRYNVVNCGRRFGKDVLAQDRAVRFAVYERAPVAWLAPSYRMLADNYRMLASTLAPIVTRKLNNERLDLLTGGFIDFWSLEQPDRIRGREYRHVILNEAAMVSGLIDTWNMIIYPTLINRRGGADFYSTPRGLNGFYSLWVQAEVLESWQRFHYSSYDNPYIPRDELDMLAGVLPERVIKQEIMAEFLSDGGYFQGIDRACVVVEPDTPDNHAGHYIFGGLDWAITDDWTVLTLACRDCNRVVDWDRFNQIDFTYQRERVMSMCERWKVAGLLPERNSIGQPNIELMRERVNIMAGPDGAPGFMTTALSKPQLIQALASALEHDGFKAPADYADELLSYEVELSASGSPRFSAPTGQHDDRVMSLALCWWSMARGAWYMS